MALIDVVKWDMQEGQYCYKFPSDDLRIGTQLVVYPSQTAFFVKGGAICDEFTAGTYTIKTENIPILNKLLNIPFGSHSPFKADVWFISRTAKLDMLWGTPQPIQLEVTELAVVVRAEVVAVSALSDAEKQRFLVANGAFLSAAAH